MKVANRVNLKSFHHKKNNSVTMYVTDVNLTYHGDHLAVYTNTKSCFTHENHIMPYVTYIT